MLDLIVSYTATTNKGEKENSIFSYADEADEQVKESVKALSFEQLQEMAGLTQSLTDLQQYGYLGDVMHPLNQEEAQKIYGCVEIYKLYPDDTESLVEDQGELDSHDGFFGIQSEELKTLLIKNEAKTSCGKNVEGVIEKLKSWGYRDIKVIVEKERTYFERTLNVGEFSEITRTEYDEMFNILPPKRFMNTCLFTMFMMCEELGGGFYQYYVSFDNRYFTFVEHLKTTYNQIENKVLEHKSKMGK